MKYHALCRREEKLLNIALVADWSAFPAFAHAFDS